jgi:L-amino acid N-acyltransferase YncA
MDTGVFPVCIAKGLPMTAAATLTIRPATESDIPTITRIYNEGIVDRIATLEVEERTEEERRAWLANRDERHPVFVAERDGVVVGWAALNVFNARAAYRFVSDFSIYVGREARGGGVGKVLLARLIEEARARGFHKMVSAAFPFNERGMRLYKNAGFREVGTFREQGVLDGKWVDTVVIELLLDNDPQPPS